MRTRTFRLVAVLLLGCVGVASTGCPWWRHPVIVRTDGDRDRHAGREEQHEHHEEHHEEHHDDERR